MKSNAPWSVKGIERDARETAKEAAKREGMTVGEWLNQMIYSAGEPESSGGAVDGLKLSDVVTAVDHLHKRVADSATEHGGAVAELSSKMGDVVERVQRLERNKPMGGDRERVEALKALEKAVSQVAVQFNSAQKITLERLDASEKSIENLSAQIAAGGDSADGAAIESLKSRIENVEQMPGAAVEVQGGDPAFIENTSNRLRVLGDEIKRGGDQIRTLEATIAKLSQQIEAAERRSAEGVHKTAETLAALRDKLSIEQSDGVDKDGVAAVVADQTRDMIERVDHLQSSLEKMFTRLDALSGDEGSAPLARDPIAPRQETAEVADAPTDESAAQEPEPSGEADDAPTQASVAEPSFTPVEDSDEEDDDDFFSFADDIDASIDETEPNERDDEFSFELDEDSELRAEGEDILSEVQNIFSGDAPAPADEDANEHASIDAELDELLAGLDESADDNDEAVAEADVETPESDISTNADTVSETTGELSTGDDEKPDDDTTAATPGKSARLTRRNLTPKQKAILAARARRKRLTEQAESDSESAKDAALKQEAVKNVFAASAIEGRDSDEEIDDASHEEETGGRFAGIRSKIPFLNRAKSAPRDQDDDVAADDFTTAGNEDGDKEALETLKKTASARPVTLALGVGIILALGLLFFLVRDLVFSSTSNPGAEQVAETTPAATGAVEEPVLEAPAPPAVDPLALYRDAMTGLNAAGNEAETAIALEKLEQAAMLGHPPAQLQLGELYKTGQGVDQDLAQARTWFRRAANGGNVLAMHRVGVMTARGEGGSANTPEAIGWFEQAANRGLVDSQYNLGAIYHPSGEGEDQPGNVQDAGKAYYWYSLAAKNGDEQATPLASGVGASLSDSQRSEIDAAIASWEAIPSDVEANALVANG